MRKLRIREKHLAEATERLRTEPGRIPKSIGLQIACPSPSRIRSHIETVFSSYWSGGLGADVGGGTGILIDSKAGKGRLRVRGFAQHSPQRDDRDHCCSLRC